MDFAKNGTITRELLNHDNRGILIIIHPPFSFSPNLGKTAEGMIREGMGGREELGLQPRWSGKYFEMMVKNVWKKIK